MTRFLFSILALSALCAVSTSSSAAASDGAFEIHQACVATGCFPGDDPGFPVELLRDGSYVLTSNLEVPDENTTAIAAGGADISIDLGGFSILGVTVCQQVPVTCAPTGSGVGIRTSFAPEFQHLSVRNGTVRGMGRFGVQANGVAEHLVVINNGATGISNGGVTRSNVAFNNGENGISGGAGIFDNRVSANGHAGISVLGGGGVIRGNTVTFNGRGDGSAGIEAVDSNVLGNIVTNNQGPGLEVLGPTTYGDNHFDSNNQAGGPTPANQVVGGGAQLGPNFCHGAPCP